jgi:hypothetical protein
MLHFNITLSNPWSDRFKNLGCKSANLSKHKAWELEHYYYSGILFELEFDFKTKCDHAGFRLSLGLLGYIISVIIYDIRHWDYALNTWSNT